MHFLPPKREHNNTHYSLNRHDNEKLEKDIKSNMHTCLLAYTNGSSSTVFSSDGVTLTFPATAIPLFASCQREISEKENEAFCKIVSGNCVPHR